jgi:hypothetical protein
MEAQCTRPWICVYDRHRMPLWWPGPSSYEGLPKHSGCQRGQSRHPAKGCVTGFLGNGWHPRQQHRLPAADVGADRRTAAAAAEVAGAAAGCCAGSGRLDEGKTRAAAPLVGESWRGLGDYQVWFSQLLRFQVTDAAGDQNRRRPMSALGVWRQGGVGDGQ